MIGETTFELLAKSLSDFRYRRKDPELARGSISTLSWRHDGLIWFYGQYEGPFWSAGLGFEMLDVVIGRETVLSATTACRSIHSFPAEYAVLSDLTAGQVVALDCIRDRVFEVDFEGGDKLLMSGELEPRWESFENFLTDYFS